MTGISDLLVAAVILILAASFVIFLLGLGLTVGRKLKMATEFGTGFSIFLVLWMGSELLPFFLPETLAEGEEILHFVVMAGFAVWMNLRWRWALRAAEEALWPST